MSRIIAFQDSFIRIIIDNELGYHSSQMPETDCLEAAKSTRGQGHEDAPIIAMTAHAIKRDREMYLGSGMNDYTSKPIKREPVFEIIEKWHF
jgi:two-component system, sensor histidine kinase and response regulator